MEPIVGPVLSAVGTFLVLLLVFRELARPVAFSGRRSTPLAVLPRFRFARLRRVPRPA